MTNKSILLAAVMAIFWQAGAQVAPVISSWKINTTGATGYGGILSNVQQVQYNTTDVYVSATCIPGYAIGPWNTNPNTPSNQNFVYKITRNPVQNTGPLVTTPMGHIGVWNNGVSVFNSKDGMSYNNQGIWNQNAYIFEGVSFDNCLGHPAPNGEYHNHINPKCVYDPTDSLNHSPIIGYAFDGFPIYGAYAYANTNGTGGIKRMKSSFTTTTTSTRVNGPNVSTTYPVGCYLEDYVFSSGLGDLDIHNGRFCVTPEYPAGIYAYFVTINGSLNPVYPYVIGPQYYGTVQSGNTGPTGGHNTPSGSLTTYTPTTAGINEADARMELQLFPNPASDYLFLFIEPLASNNFTVELIDAQGRVVLTEKNIQPTISYSFDVSKAAKGLYTFKIQNERYKSTQKVLIK
jgi:hypothetical protein